MTENPLQHTVALLTRTPAALNALLRDLPETWTRRNEGEKTWSAFDIVGHLIHGEVTDWLPRARRILEFGESTPFDRFAQEPTAKASRWASCWMSSPACAHRIWMSCTR